MGLGLQCLPILLLFLKALPILPVNFKFFLIIIIHARFILNFSFVSNTYKICK